MPAEPLTATVYIEAPPDRVFGFFTRPEAMITWMGERAVIEPTPGGRFEVDVKGAPVRGRFLRLDPPHMLLISWGYAGSEQLPAGASTVEIRLTADGTGTRVDLEHRDLPSSERPGHASGWTHYLARLQIAGEGRHPDPDPGMPEPQLGADHDGQVAHELGDSPAVGRGEIRRRHRLVDEGEPPGRSG